MALNGVAKNEGLKSGTGGGIVGAVTHIGILTTTDPGTGTDHSGTEAVGGSPAYARQAVTWGTPASGVVANTGALTFDVPAGTYAHFGMFSASSGNTNTYRGYLPFGGSVKGFGAVDADGVTNDNVKSAGHGLVNTDRVIVYNVFAESLPTGLTEGTLYFVVGATTDTFQVSLTSGGAAVNLTAAGELAFQKVVPDTFVGQGQITVAIGALTVDLTGI